MIEKIMTQHSNDNCDSEPRLVLSVGCGSHANIESSYNKLNFGCHTSLHWGG
jgi:hypothetical protein